MATLTELLSKLDKNIHIRGHQFENICQWYLENDPKYKLELKKVWLWNKWPGRWGPDAGIDLIAKTFDNKLWAIQVKAYSPTHSITKADVDTFLSESSREVFSYRLLIATTNFIGRTAERTLYDQEKPVGQVLLSNLEKSYLSWPASPEKLVAQPTERKKPRPHQQKAVNDVCRGFSNNTRGQLIMACGTGKTLVALWASEKLKSRRTLILLPSLSLLAQTLREWTANTSNSFQYLPVCSDDTVRGADRFISRTSDLGLQVTTNPDEVAEFLRRRGPIIVFSTYQSSPVVAEAFRRENVPAFELAIADEAHRCAGIGSGLFATILDATAIKAKRRLFMTATPRYFTDRVHKEAQEIDFEIASMDDETKFGPKFHQLSFSEAIEQDLLCDYQVIVVGVDNSTYLKYAERGMFVTTDGKYITDARTLASHIALAKAMRKYDLQKVVSFHSRIKRAKEFSNQLVDVIKWMPEDARPIGNLWSKHVTGEMPSGRRDALLNRFRHLEDEERGLLANARCLAEGIDLPTLDAVAFIDPRSSQLDIVQAIGRAIRKAQDKKVGTVVLPVFIGSIQDSEIALDSSVFKPVWNVLKALRAHDDVLAETLDQIRRQIGRHGNKRFALPQKLFIDLPVTVGKSFAEAFKIKLVERSTTSWEFWFGLLERYVKQKQNALVPSNYITEDGFALGIWVVKRRYDYRQGKLPRKLQEALEQLPGWLWDTASELAWNEGFERLLEYVEHHGDVYMKSNYMMEDGYRLGAWVRCQKYSYGRGRLSPDRQEALQQLAGWTWDERFETAWKEGFENLLKYVDSEASACVPQTYVTNDGYRLGAWVNAQRMNYTQGKLSLDRQKAFEELPGWKWTPKETAWQKRFKRLQMYVEQSGSALIPSDYVTPDGYRLGRWVVKQRYAYNKGHLSKKSAYALKQLPGWSWDSNESAWEKGFRHLLKYIRREGTANVPRAYVAKDGYNLGNWVGLQRYNYRNGKLPKDKRQKLDKILDFVWDPHDTRWQKGFDFLCRYLEFNRNSYPRRTYVTVEGYPLGSWLRTQRSYFRIGKLPLEHQSLLEQLPNWVSDPHEYKWQKGFGKLYEFVQNMGHARVKSDYLSLDGFNLGGWVRERRQEYRRGKLSSERQKALEELSGWVWRSPNKPTWIESFERLRKYVELEGHTRVPTSYVTSDGHTLGRWVFRQCQLYRRGQLSSERQQALEQLPGWTWRPPKGRRIIKCSVKERQKNRKHSLPKAAGMGLGRSKKAR